MKISTVVDLDLLRRFAELGQWPTATELYFNMCLEGVDPARREELHEAVWARDGGAVATVVGRLAGASRLPASQARVKPLPPRAETLRGRGASSPASRITSL